MNKTKGWEVRDNSRNGMGDERGGTGGGTPCLLPLIEGFVKI